jgi:dTDP-4-amino-4,6-dideoxygalactose transaminase
VARDERRRGANELNVRGKLTRVSRAGFTFSDRVCMNTIPHNRLTFGPPEIQAVNRVVASGHWAGGKKLRSLEQALCELTGRRYAVGVASGISALRLALLAVGVRSGDRVAIPAYSCVALANAVLSVGAVSQPIDVINGVWNLDPQALRTSRKVKAVIAVHTFGMPSSLRALKMSGIPLIEDCAHAIGLKTADGPLGSVADVAITSFHATKLIGAGEGGAVLTDRPDIALFVKNWRDYTDQPPNALRLNDKITDLESALALAQLRRLPQMITKRRRLALRYDRALTPLMKKTHFCRLPRILGRRVWYRYAVEMLKSDPESFIAKLRQRGVIAETPVSDWRGTALRGSPVADRAYRRLVSLPLYPSLTANEQRMVCASIRSIILEQS